MIKWKVKEAAQAIGIDNATQLRAKTGLGQSTCYGLWDNKSEHVARNTINVLCRVLQVNPGVLIEYVPDESQPGRGKKKATKSKPTL